MKFDTQQVHAGHQPDSASLSRAVPIYQTTSYVFKDSEHARRLFEVEEEGNIYTRLSNPTTTVLEKRLAALEGGIAAVAVASGHAAQFIALNNFLKVGDEFVSTPFLYGGTYNQFKNTFKTLGIKVKFAKNLQPESFEKLITHNTKAIYLETIGNPSFEIPDFELFSKLAQKYDIPLVVDNTFGAGGYLFKPIEYGANVVVASATKWIGGHGNSMGGIIIDGGNYNWGNGNFSQFSEPSSGYHNLIFAEKFGPKSPLGNIQFSMRARLEGLRDFGPALSPFNAFLLLQGVETLSLRVDKAVQNTLQLAKWLSSHPKVAQISYPGLATDKNYKNAQKYLKKGAGSVLTFNLKNSKKETSKFVESLKLVSHLANIGDTRTLIIQPAATTHQQLTEQEQTQAGISPSLLRVSVGIEDIEDIIADFDQALKNIS